MTHSILIIAVSALTTMAIRFFPFLVFGKRKVPEILYSIWDGCCPVPLWQHWWYIV